MEQTRDGIFSRLVEQEAQTPATTATAASWTCACGGCALALGEGADLGAYATTPTDASWDFVAQAPGQGASSSVAALMAGARWSSVDGADRTVISYSFIDPATSTIAYGAQADVAANPTAFSLADRQLTRELLASISEVCNVQFVEVADNASECGVLRYGYSTGPNAMNYAGYAFFPSSDAIGGDIWIGANQAGAQWDFYRPNLLLHETLHAIGLKHPFSGSAVLPTSQDVIPNTVMSYSPVAGGGAGFMSVYPREPMSYDVAALQQLYGATAQATGDDRYDLADASFQSGFRSLWDSAGIDTLDASGVGRAVTLDLAAGANSDIGVRIDAGATVAGNQVLTTYTSTFGIATGAVIENAAGSAFGDTLRGNAIANRLQGNGGDDVLEGGAGIDTAVYAGESANFQIARTGATLVVSDAAGTEGRDSLAGIERLQFADQGLAMDLGGNAGIAARVLGAVFGADAVHNAQWVGEALHFLDAGIGEGSAMQLALDIRLGANASDADVVDLLYTNVVGQAPDAATGASFEGMLARGECTQATLGMLAAHSALNLQNIGFNALVDGGLAFA